MNIPRKHFVLAMIAAAIALVMTLTLEAAAQQAPAQQAPAPKQLPRDGFPLGPSAKILSFTASAASIQAGQSVTLKWEVINADRIELDQGIGIVATRDSRTVTPTATATYTLSARGGNGTGSDTRTVTVTVTGSSAAATSVPEREPAGRPTVSEAMMRGPAPRMPDGKPDLNGLYIAPFHSIKPIDEIKLKPGAEKYKVGPEVERFDNIQVGDTVVLRYTEAIGLRMIVDK